MASATIAELTAPSGLAGQLIPHDLHTHSTYDAGDWATLLKKALVSLQNPVSYSLTPAIRNDALHAPRRRHANPQSSELAAEIANLLYPAPLDARLSQLIKYEKDIVALRHAIKTQIQEEAAAASKDVKTKKRIWTHRILSQGPWSPLDDPLPVAGPSALPMPVDIADKKSLRPFFQHLSGHDDSRDDGNASFVHGKEPWYDVDVDAWEKGMLYKDGRMDLCKMVLGPPNITTLMESLSTNVSVRHFLLGNNIIGPVGANAIAAFSQKYPDRIETWYLAGNCIDGPSLTQLTNAWVGSHAITNIWLKRNPLGPSASSDIYRLITQIPNLRTLDLDQTELGDNGVATLFRSLILSTHGSLSLRNIYLNATGTSIAACKAIAHFLASPDCTLESLYLSMNPIGDAGAQTLSEGLRQNTSLERLIVDSCGINTQGATAIFAALVGHPNLFTLSIAQSYATQDLNARYNFLEDGTGPSLAKLISHENCHLKYVSLGLTMLSAAALNEIAKAAAFSDTLEVFDVGSVHADVRIVPATAAYLSSKLHRNVETHYNGLNYEEFQQGEKRWLISPKDVRFIDSGYRNRDAALARRGKLILKKWWDEDADLVSRVMDVETDWGDS